MQPRYAQFSSQDTAKMEEITGVPATAMLTQSGLLPSPPKDAVVLDNACGGGLVTALIFSNLKNTAAGVRVVCGDLEQAMVESAGERIKAHGWDAETVVADAQALPFEDHYFTHTLTNFGIQLIPDKARVFTESFRVLKPGGKLGFTTWTEPGWLDSMLKAGVPGFVAPPIFSTGPLASAEGITGLLTSAGFTKVDVQPVVFEHADSMERYLGYMKTLFAQVLVGEGAERYERYMKERYGDGEFGLTWRAFVVTAERP